MYMAYSKKRVFKKKVKSNKKRNSRSGGCGCSQNSQSSEQPSQKGGGDYFLGGYKEPPSFSNVPISSFYPQNMHTAGGDVQAAQISSRGLPNMSSGGGKKPKNKKNKTNKKNKKSKTNKRNRKMKGGSINYSLFTRDPLLGNSSDPVSSVGNTSGAIQAANIFNQGGASNYASSSANMKATLLV